MDPEALQTVLGDPQQLLFLRLVLHPSVHVIASRFAVFSLWAAHQGTQCLSNVDPDVAQTALVFRNALEVDALELSAGAGLFVSALQRAESLVEAVAAASSAEQDFDLVNTIALLIRFQLLISMQTGNESREHTH